MSYVVQPRNKLQIRLFASQRLWFHTVPFSHSNHIQELLKVEIISKDEI